MTISPYSLYLYKEIITLNIGALATVVVPHRLMGRPNFISWKATVGAPVITVLSSDVNNVTVQEVSGNPGTIQLYVEWIHSFLSDVGLTDRTGMVPVYLDGQNTFQWIEPVGGGGGGPVPPHGGTHSFGGIDPIPSQEQIEAQYAYVGPLAVRDTVYESAAGTVQQAIATGIATMPVIGVVKTILPLNQCIIVRKGEVPGYAVLVPDVPYYASDAVAGGISNAPPGAPTANKVEQVIGFAKTADILDVNPQTHIILA